jgi:hypothetical protein
MSGAEPPVGATSGSSAAVPSSPPPLQQQEITAAQFSDAIRETIRQQQEITAAQLSDAIREIIRQQQQQQQQQQEITAAARSQSDELRGWLMFVVTLTASITYSAALNPPGGVWQADDPAKGYIAGKPVLSNTFHRRYNAFYYSNFTSFATSLAIIALSSTPKLYNRIQRLLLLSNLVTLDLVALAGAFVTGSWTSPYVSFGAALLAVGVFMFPVVEILVGASAPIDIDQSV